MKTVELIKNRIKNARCAVLGFGVSNIPLVELLLECGNEITVHDKNGFEKLDNRAQEFSACGVRFVTGDDYLDKIDADIIFRSPWIRPDYKGIVKAVRNGAELISEMELFLELSPARVFAITGSDGKTTTTNFIKQLLKDEPIAYIIGDGTGGGCTNYKYLIYEACEYQDHFLVYNPDILVITNIDYDHPDYFKSIDEVRKSFAILKEKSKMTIEQEEYEIIEISKNLTKFKYDSNIYSVRLFGDHLISDLVIAIKVLFKLGFDYKYIVDRLNRIKMPKRRMQESIISNTIIIEDYGHHPTEINALIQSINIKYPNIYKICLFQPHTYSRTLMFYKDFIKSLRYFDEVYVDEVFTSKREPYDLNKQNKINYIFNEFNNYLEFDFDNLDLRKKQMIILLGAGDLNKRFFENVKMKTE